MAQLSGIFHGGEVLKAPGALADPAARGRRRHRLCNEDRKVEGFESIPIAETFSWQADGGRELRLSSLMARRVRWRPPSAGVRAIPAAPGDRFR